ncbi:MAG TPA: hydrogenase maturation nickel metallochaperone HypA [Verrucomicrobiae bacterium]|nr:hydrogenase maturation nickel metallochaperone HypA [Verrucomicrobiae bacterium]
MHEVHLVRAVLETVEKQAVAQNARRVTRVHIRFNPLTSHSGDHVRFSFDLVKKDIPLVKDAALELTEVEPTLRCLNCAHQFPGHHLPDACPRCGSVNVRAVHSTDMVLESFEIER